MDTEEFEHAIDQIPPSDILSPLKKVRFNGEEMQLGGGEVDIPLNDGGSVSVIDHAKSEGSKLHFVDDAFRYSNANAFRRTADTKRFVWFPRTRGPYRRRKYYSKRVYKKNYKRKIRSTYVPKRRYRKRYGKIYKFLKRFVKLYNT